jgi:hypothetical protein
MTKDGRKLILVRTDLLEEASKITAKEGKTMFAFTNEIFERAIDAYAENVTLADAINIHKMVQVSKIMGFAVVPSDIFSHMIKELSEVERQALLDQWYESGEWNGSYLNMKFQQEDKLEIVRRFVEANLWNLQEFTLDSSKDKIEVKCFSPNLSLECVEMLAQFLHGMFDSLGYSVNSNKCLRGMIHMKLETSKKEPIGRSPEDHTFLEGRA